MEPYTEELYDNLDFTMRGEDSFYNIVDDKLFATDDVSAIFRTIEKKSRYIPFCEYLKRYIYRRAGMTGDYNEIPLSEYQHTIVDCFRENATPVSFSPTTTKLSAQAKNWLTRPGISRNAVFLLGFGLAMNVDDVNDFLRKGLREQGINAKDPFEVICWYCYKNGYSYPKFESLMHAYNETPVGTRDMSSLYNEYTVNLHSAVRNLSSDTALMNYILQYKSENNTSAFSKTVYETFCTLYKQAQAVAADTYNKDNEKDAEVYKARGIRKTERKVYTPEEISGYDIEQNLYTAVPKDRNNNLVPDSQSKLHEHFNGYRLTRRRIADILAGKTEASRYDLITLHFFVFAGTRMDAYENKYRCTDAFVASANELLEKCFLSPLYMANPYECFIMACIWSSDPIGTFADVNEAAYSNHTEDQEGR